MKKELTLLREEMKKHHIQAYLIPTDDFHGSEYVGEYFKGRKYVSGFTGSAGSLLVMEHMAGLWTDGRYFLQAASQLNDSGITLFKSGESGVPSMEEFLEENLAEGMTLAFDGRCMMQNHAIRYQKLVQDKGARLITEYDLLDAIWPDRPDISKEAAWILPEKYSGKSTCDKIEMLRKSMEEKNADYHLIASLDDICWILNVRGNDVRNTPVVLSYLLMTQDKVTWFVHGECLNDTVKDAMNQAHVSIADYHEVYEALHKMDAAGTILYDPSRTNARLVSSIPANMKVLEETNPSQMMKALKNPVEVDNERLAHIKDGIVLTQFMYYLKKKALAAAETEISLGRLLGELRKKQEDYVEESFDPIVAYGDHGAIVHYTADEKSNRRIEGKGFLLVDTGGQYLQGTTDVTRTFAMGSLSQKEKELYTAVLRAHINLSSARFLPGCTGQSLDVLARTPLWDMGYDYKHGTGHGVGYLLNVHEGPNEFRYKSPANKNMACIIEEGMITSDEPGVYLEGEFGIRLENMVVCQKDKEYQSFLSFEPLTMVPFEKEAILKEAMTEKEIAWLNHYHEMVYQKIAPALNDEERIWLRQATSVL